MCSGVRNALWMGLANFRITISHYAYKITSNNKKWSHNIGIKTGIHNNTRVGNNKNWNRVHCDAIFFRAEPSMTCLLDVSVTFQSSTFKKKFDWSICSNFESHKNGATLSFRNSGLRYHRRPRDICFTWTEHDCYKQCYSVNISPWNLSQLPKLHFVSTM